MLTLLLSYNKLSWCIPDLNFDTILSFFCFVFPSPSWSLVASYCIYQAQCHSPCFGLQGRVAVNAQNGRMFWCLAHSQRLVWHEAIYMTKPKELAICVWQHRCSPGTENRLFEDSKQLSLKRFPPFLASAIPAGSLCQGKRNKGLDLQRTL